jgi:hypothetical protein
MWRSFAAHTYICGARGSIYADTHACAWRIATRWMLQLHLAFGVNCWPALHTCDYRHILQTSCFTFQLMIRALVLDVRARVANWIEHMTFDGVWRKVYFNELPWTAKKIIFYNGLKIYNVKHTSWGQISIQKHFAYDGFVENVNFHFDLRRDGSCEFCIIIND